MKQPILMTLIALAAACLHRLCGNTLAANTYDAAVETHEATVRRANDAAVTDRHLLWKKGAADGSIALNGATDPPLGTVDNTEPETGKGQTVHLLGRGPTKKMVASKAIAAGVRVFTAASGKATDTHGANAFQLGISLTAAAADGDIIEVNDCAPVKTNA